MPENPPSDRTSFRGQDLADRIALDPAVSSGTVLVPWEHAPNVTYGLFNAPSAPETAAARLEEHLLGIIKERLEHAGGPSGRGQL